MTLWHSLILLFQARILALNASYFLKAGGYFVTSIKGVECYWLSILPLPMGVIDKLYAICRKFLWSTKHPPISWTTCCSSKESGGLGLKDLKAWNKSLLAKTLWFISCKKETLWIKWLHHYYLNNNDVWQWNSKREFSPLIKKLIDIKDDILREGGCLQVAEQILHSWFLNKGGVTKAYHFFSSKNQIWPWKPIIWKTCIAPKHSFTLWLFAHRKLLTKDRQPYVEDKSCQLCGNGIENLNHLFFDCLFSKSVWNQVRNWLGMRKLMSSANAILKAFRNTYRGSSFLCKMRLSAMAATIYHIWNMRNRVLFENETQDAALVFRKIQLHVYRMTDRNT